MKFSARFVALMILALATFGMAGTVVAEDLTDNDTCLECHEGAEREPPADPNVPQVHNPEGGFFVEAHEMWSCVDCHTAVEEIPHPEDISEQTVDCLNCHEEVPQK